MRLILFISSIVATFVLGQVHAQSPKPEIIGNKVETTAHRQMADFKHVKIVAVDAELVKGNESKVDITAESNIVDHIISRMSGDTLIVGPDLDFQLRNITTPKIKITYREINTILGSVATIKMLTPVDGTSLKVKLQSKSSLTGTLKLQTLELSMSNSCKATLSGSADNAMITLWTKSYLNAKNLKISKAQITEETLCEADLYVSGELSAMLFAESKIQNSGKAKPNITYPSIDQMASMPKTIGRNLDLYTFE
jgi:hypothetical protein